MTTPVPATVAIAAFAELHDSALPVNAVLFWSRTVATSVIDPPVLMGPTGAAMSTEATAGTTGWVAAGSVVPPPSPPQARSATSSTIGVTARIDQP